MPAPDTSEFDAIREADELRRTVQTLQRQLRQAKAKTGDLVEAVYQAARDASLAMGKPPAVPKPRADRRTRRAEAAVLLLSDWHFGKQTVSFNTDVARDRIRLLTEKVSKITDIERADHPVREIHVLLAGDMADNTTIFPGHAWEVDSTMFSQVFAVSQALEEMLRHLLSRFDRVVVWEQFGNHGRVGRKGDLPRSDNLDRLIYGITRERLADDRLTWNAADGWYTIVEVGAYRALLVHGDQIKSFGGNVPAYGILRKCNAWASGVLPPFTDVMLGHFHQPLVLPLANGRGRAWVNPSIESDSAFAQEFVAATGTPGQRLNFVDPDKGRVTAERVVWVDEA